VNILISANKPFLNPAFVMISSLRRYNSENIDVYFLNSSIDSKFLGKFNKRLSKLDDVKLHIIDINKTNFSDMPVPTQWSIEVYNRVLAQFLLPNDLDRVLYLDADIVIKKDLSAYYHQSFDDNWIVASIDKIYKRELMRQHKENLGISPEHKYFNSGVILFNLDALRKNTSLEQISDTLLSLKDKIKFPDQDILNFLYQGKVKYADMHTYNCQVSKNECDTKENTAIIHFVGPNKPWSRFTGFSKYWWQEALNNEYGIGFYLSFIWFLVKNCAIHLLYLLRNIIKKF
jgi:lipopolysaccharide biosynthesis glycosyltransferase